MAVETEIYDYVDDSDTNRFKKWLDDIGPGPTATINARLTNLADEPLTQWGQKKYAEKLSGQDDLWAIRVQVGKVRYRPIGIMGPDQNTFTLLAGATHSGHRKNKGYKPLSVFKTAQQRKANVRANPTKHRVRHSIKKTT